VVFVAAALEGFDQRGGPKAAHDAHQFAHLEVLDRRPLFSCDPLALDLLDRCCVSEHTSRAMERLSPGRKIGPPIRGDNWY
jgi:hypothetical protein